MATLFQVRFTKAELDRLGCTHSELLEEGCRACHVSAALRRSFIVDELPDYPDLLEAPDDWYGIRWWTRPADGSSRAGTRTATQRPRPHSPSCSLSPRAILRWRHLHSGTPGTTNDERRAARPGHRTALSSPQQGRNAGHGTHD